MDKHNVSKILEAPTSNIPWEHKIIRNALNTATVVSLLKVFNIIDWDNAPKDSFQEGIYTKDISKDFISSLPASLAKQVLSELKDTEAHELLLQHYNYVHNFSVQQNHANICLLYK